MRFLSRCHYVGPVALLLVCGCSQKTVSDTPPPQAPPVSSAWNAALANAKRDSAYAGSYVESGNLWIGFTHDADRKIAAVAKQSDIRSYTAQHSTVELERAFKSTVGLLEVSKFGATSVNIDYRLSAVTVSTAYTLQDSGGPIPKCSALPTIPETAPETKVMLIDVRDCKK